MQELAFDYKEKIILELYENQKDDFHIILPGDSNVKFGAVIKNSQISFLFDGQDENATLECYFLIPAIKDQNVKLDIQTNFKAKNTKILINVIAIASDNASITLNGNLHVENNIKDVEAKLYEETLLIGNAKYISMIPGLRVDSPDVIASHGAKIQRISPERIFYMQSRGLDQDKAIDMIINSYSHQIASKLQLDDKQQSDFYSMIK